MVRHLILSVALSAILVGGGWEAPAAEPGVSLVAVGDCSCLFAGRRTELELRATSDKAFRGAAGWSLAVSGRTIARGETALAVGPGQTAGSVIPLDVPAVREGLIVPAELTVELHSLPERTVVARRERRLWICSEEAFAGRSKWLEQLQIRLFDPAGKTRDVFKEAGIPFSQTANVESLATGKEGLVVIGEGVSLEAYRGLPGIMVKAAARGTPVLCLAPADGQVDVPGSAGAEWPDPEYLALRRSSVIRGLDKRLDAESWPPDGKIASRGLALRSERNRVLAQVTDQGKGWPWLEVGFTARRGRLIVCLFDVIEKWEAGPVPRFLLVRLFEYLDGDARPGPAPDNTPLIQGETR
jgi:hypothetical protein